MIFLLLKYETHTTSSSIEIFSGILKWIISKPLEVHSFQVENLEIQRRTSELQGLKGAFDRVRYQGSITAVSLGNEHVRTLIWFVFLIQIGRLLKSLDIKSILSSWLSLIRIPWRVTRTTREKCVTQSDRRPSNGRLATGDKPGAPHSDPDYVNQFDSFVSLRL